MNGKKMMALIGLVLISAPAAYAFAGPQDEQVVTGHTVFNEVVIVIEEERNRTSFKPTDFAAKAGRAVIEERLAFRLEVQRECVVWFDGTNLDQQPDPAIDDSTNGFDMGDDENNSFPSDEDNGSAGDDPAEQDYDFDRDVDTCDPENLTEDNQTFRAPRFVVAVEAGDCDPASSGATGHRFRGSLDFIDPNGVFHEVQEYDYFCSDLIPGLGNLGEICDTTAGVACTGHSGPGGLPVAGSPWDDTLGGLMTSLFPWSDCHKGGAPVASTNCWDPTDPSTQPGSSNEFNGTMQELWRERMWITETHPDTLDPTIGKVYNFALQVDTCDGLNPYDAGGTIESDPFGILPPVYHQDQKGDSGDFNNTSFDGYHYPGQSSNASDDEGPDGGLTKAVLGGRDGDGGDYGALYDFLDGFGLAPWGMCTDGSSFSFDDTSRSDVIHAAPPASTDEIEEGNSFNGVSHRENCRSVPPASNGVDQTTCYPEDHFGALIDIYVYDEDPTDGLFDLN